MPTVGQTSPRSLPQPTAGTWVTWHPPTVGLLSPLADSMAHPAPVAPRLACEPKLLWPSVLASLQLYSAPRWCSWVPATGPSARAVPFAPNALPLECFGQAPSPASARSSSESPFLPAAPEPRPLCSALLSLHPFSGNLSLGNELRSFVSPDGKVSCVTAGPWSRPRAPAPRIVPGSPCTPFFHLPVECCPRAPSRWPALPVELLLETGPRASVFPVPSPVQARGSETRAGSPRPAGEAEDPGPV